MTAAGLAAAREIAKDIKLSHSVFALPFALLGAFLALPPVKRVMMSDGFRSRFLARITG